MIAYTLVAIAVERASRLIVFTSMVLAGVAHGWLAHTTAALTLTTVAAFAGTLVLARSSRTTALAVIGLSAYSTPALFAAAFGVYNYHQLSIWLAAVSAAVLARPSTSRWHYPRPWTVPLAAWALVLAVTWPLVAARELDFSLVAAHTVGVANGIARLSPPEAAAFVTLVAWGQLLGLLWLDLLWAQFRNDRHGALRWVAVPLLIGIAISSVVGIYQRLGDIDFLNLPIWANLPRAGGLMNDANSFGIGAAIWAPVAVTLGWALGRTPLSVVAYVVLAAGMWSAGSRTALLTLIAGTIGLGVALLKRRGVWQPALGRLAALLLLAGVVLAIAVVPRSFDGGSPLQRAFDRIPRLDATEIRRFVVDDLWVRFGYGQAAVDIIRDHPIAGVGIGAFHFVAPDYVYRRSHRAIESDNAQNWWRHQIAELGLLGALPALCASVLVLTLLRGAHDTEPRGTITVLRAVIVGVGLSSLVGVPTQHPATWISFATLMFWLQTMVTGAGAPGGSSRTLWVAGFVLAAVTAAATMSAARHDLRPLTRALETVTPHAQGLSGIEGLSDYGEVRWSGKRSLAAVPVINRWMQLTLWAPYRDPSSRNIVATIALDGREILRHPFTTSASEIFFIAMPEGKPAITLAVAVEGSVPTRRAIQVAITWRGQVPTGVHASRIIR